MIQDIAPHRLVNVYRPDARPAAGSVVLFYDGLNLLFAREGEPFTYAGASALCDMADVELTYFFSIDDTLWFWAHTTPDAVLQHAVVIDRKGLRSLPEGPVAYAAVTAAHIRRWYVHRRFCGVCGAPNAHDSAERAMRCTVCGNLEYPQIMPSVIVAVTHGSRLLLTKYSPLHRMVRNYVLIAGYNEVGEGIEDTVRREVLEEVGIQVRNIRFYKSQPWGFSGSLLFGFYCDLDGDDETLHLQEDELSEGTWFDRSELPEGGSSISLTHEMIERFRQGPV